jgi:hypothetical protein
MLSPAQALSDLSPSPIRPAPAPPPLGFLPWRRACCLLGDGPFFNPCILFSRVFGLGCLFGQSKSPQFRCLFINCPGVSLILRQGLFGFLRFLYRLVKLCFGLKLVFPRIGHCLPFERNQTNTIWSRLRFLQLYTRGLSSEARLRRTRRAIRDRSYCKDYGHNHGKLRN